MWKVWSSGQRLQQFQIFIEWKRNFQFKKLIDLMIFIQIYDTKNEFDFSINHRSIKFFRNVQRRKIKNKKLIIRWIIKISVTVWNYETIKIILNCDNEINLIKKHFVKKLNLKVYVLKNIDLIIFNNKSF